jgi:hypothetical protein
MANRNPGRLLTDVEVASRLGVRVGKVREWRTIGYGPVYIRVGGRIIRYREADLAAFIESSRVDPRGGGEAA